MQRIQADAPPAPPTRTEEEILAHLEGIQEELERARAVKAADAKRKSLLNAAKVLVPASPSPRKKRARQEEHFNSGPPPPRPAFAGYDSTTAGPPSYTHADTFAPPPKKQSEFASHESALRPSKFEEGLHSMAKQTKATGERRTTISSRSTGFGVQSVAPRSVGALASGSSSKSGSAKGKEVEKKRTSTRSSATSLAQSLARETAAAKPSMSRQAHAPKAAPERAASKRISNVDEVEEDDDSDGLDVVDGPTKPRTRRRDGTVIERVEQGPIDHPPIPGDPTFDTIEPNSGIRLRPKSRLISHEGLQSHLSDRYHLSPALLYSFTRTSSSGPSGSLEVDLVGDFIVIAVLAWKDEARFKNPNALKAEVKVEKARKRWEGVKGAEEEAPEEEEEEEEEESVWKKQTKKQKTSRYIRFTLVDLSTEAAAASGTGTLHLLLFEAESQDTVVEESGYKVPRYKGGSGGAYEKFWKEPVGSILAILNPRVLKSQPKPGRPNVLTLTPESADSMMVIGRARDLSSCQALRANGSLCGDWCDARVNKFCEWHVSRAVKGTGAGRAETYSANSSLNNTTAFSSKKFAQAFKPGSRKPAFDPLTKTGLLPRTNVSILEGAKTYVVAGSGSNVSRVGKNAAAGLRAAAIQSGNGAGGFIQGVRDGPTVERAKRDVREAKVAKARRIEEARELMERDKGTSLGGRYVELADKKRREVEREFVKRNGGAVEEEGGKRRRKGEKSESEKEEVKEKKRRRTFTTAAVRLIGYDPTTKGAAERDEDDESKRSRLDAISSLSINADRPTPNLRAPPGVKVRSGVVAPREVEDDLPDYRRREKKASIEEEDDDDDLVVEGAPAAREGGPKVKFADEARGKVLTA